MITNNLIGLIPAAGKGERLGLPFPKELFPTIEANQYKPIAQYVVDQLQAAEVNHIVFIINENKHQLLGYFGGGKKFNCNFSYVVQDSISNKPSSSPGLANALASSYHLIQGKTVLFGMADTIMWPKDVFKSTLNSLDSNADMTLCLFPTKYPQKFGMVSYNSEMKVKKIVDKPITTDLTFMWGAIIWQPTFSDFLFKKVNSNESSDFAEIINLAIDNHLLIKTKTFPTGRFVDFGTYEQILDTSLMNPIRYD